MSFSAFLSDFFNRSMIDLYSPQHLFLFFILVSCQSAAMNFEFQIFTFLPAAEFGSELELTSRLESALLIALPKHSMCTFTLRINCFGIHCFCLFHLQSVNQQELNKDMTTKSQRRSFFTRREYFCYFKLKYEFNK